MYKMLGDDKKTRRLDRYLKINYVKFECFEVHFKACKSTEES